jgi:DNA mismatch repair ATPase MutL
VEELILNSIDAGATDIKIEIQLPDFFSTSDDIPQIVIHDDGAERQKQKKSVLQHFLICMNDIASRAWH